MKLTDLNQNNIKLGNPRTTGDQWEYGVPHSWPQRDKVHIDSDSDEVEDETLGDETDDNDVEDIKKDHKRQIDLISMVNSWAPKRDLPDIRRPPNTSNIQ